MESCVNLGIWINANADIFNPIQKEGEPEISYTFSYILERIVINNPYMFFMFCAPKESLLRTQYDDFKKSVKPTNDTKSHVIVATPVNTEREQISGSQELEDIFSQPIRSSVSKEVITRAYPYLSSIINNS